MKARPAQATRPPAAVQDAPMRSLAAQLKEFAFGLPDAYEDFPWGESAAKVKGKVFVFFGRGADLDEKMMLTVKLPVSGEGILTLDFAEPTGYGLGRSGWVTVTCRAETELPLELLREWVVESYRAVAPKRSVARLDENMNG
ncbi:MAG: MmcQ/YjbR family DNA-binding protein [Myxococcota bacterium]